MFSLITQECLVGARKKVLHEIWRMVQKLSSESATRPLEHAWFKRRKRMKSNITEEGESFQGALMNSRGASGRSPGVSTRRGDFRPISDPTKIISARESKCGREREGQTEHRVRAIRLLAMCLYLQVTSLFLYLVPFLCEAPWYCVGTLLAMEPKAFPIPSSPPQLCSV